MMSDFISEQEKTIWMMMAWLEENNGTQFHLE
jgi:hypothetical protein